MSEAEARDRAKQVAGRVEQIYSALLRAHRLLFRTAVRSQPEIGSGHPSADDERHSPLGEEYFTDTSRVPVVIGFWSRDMKTPKYVCSLSGMNIICAVRDLAADQLRVRNSWRTKNSAGVYDNFLRAARDIQEDVQEIDPEDGELALRHEIDMRRMHQLLDVCFLFPEAEARMASYLMRHDVVGTVHLYGTDSPCGDCSDVLRQLGPARQRATERFQNRVQNPIAHRRFPPPGDEPLPGLRWRFGWVFYGRLYRTNNADRTTDPRVLDEAVRLGGIEGHGCL